MGDFILISTNKIWFSGTRESKPELKVDYRFQNGVNLTKLKKGIIIGIIICGPKSILR